VTAAGYVFCSDVVGLAALDPHCILVRNLDVILLNVSQR
jgi:hypothetical protein